MDNPVVDNFYLGQCRAGTYVYMDLQLVFDINYANN